MASKEAKKVDKTVRGHSDSADPNQIVLEPKGRKPNALPGLRDPSQSDEQFPTTAYESPEEEDALMTAKLQMQQQGKGVTPFGVLQAKDSDFEWLRRKREASEYANFSQWFAQNFDKMDVTQKKLAKELFPSFYNERLQQLDRSISLQAKLAKLKLLGIEGKEDLMLQYAAEAGYIDADPLENILHPERVKALQKEKERQTRFGRGLLNPNRLLRGDWGQKDRATNSSALTGRQSASPKYGAGNPFFASDPTPSGAHTSPDWEGNMSAQAQHDFMKQLL